MANPNTSEKSNALDREENVTKGNLSAKRVAIYSYDAGLDQLEPVNSDNPLPIGGSITATPTVDADYSVNDISEGTTSYFGYTDTDAAWMVKKVTDTSVSYATVTNNGAVTTYTDAWANKLTLTYGRKDEAF